MDNSSDDSGGGIECYASSNPQISNNIIAYNWAGLDGGGIDIYNDSSPVLVNNTIVQNSAQLGGGISLNLDCEPDFMNTII